VFLSADAYDRFMGRYSEPLAERFAAFARLRPGQRVLDVGCGTGVLTVEMIRRLGTAAVSAVDPSQTFVAAMRSRLPQVDVHEAVAEDLPFEDATFDAALAQLVVHFMSDPAAGIGEMRRVTRPGGVIAGCVWDYAGRHAPLEPFWKAARSLDPVVDDESERPGTSEGDLVALFRAAELGNVEQDVLSIELEHPSFDDWWQPFTLGIGPAGAHYAGLAPNQQAELEARCRSALDHGPFTVTARAWAVRGEV
jgi:SAM-dependent methyltransferase